MAERKKVRLKKQELVVVGLLIGILLVSFVLYRELRDYREELQANPLTFGAKKYNINVCSCITEKGTDFYFNQTTVWQIRKYTPMIPDLNLSAFS
jgi:hypothetical protein